MSTGRRPRRQRRAMGRDELASEWFHLRMFERGQAEGRVQARAQGHTGEELGSRGTGFGNTSMSTNESLPPYTSTMGVLMFLVGYFTTLVFLDEVESSGCMESGAAKPAAAGARLLWREVWKKTRPSRLSSCST